MPGQERMDFWRCHIFSLITLPNCACRHDGNARPPQDYELPHAWASIRVQHRHPPCVFVGRPKSHRLILDNDKIHPPDIQTGTPRSRIRCDFIYTVLLRSGMDTPTPRTRNIKYNLRPTQRDEFPNNPFTRLTDVNISGANNTPCTWLPVKSNSGSHLGTDLSDASINPEKRNDDRTTQLLSVSSPTPTTITVVPIQTSAPPLSKMGQYTTNYPPVLGIYRDLQGQVLLRQVTRLDANDTN